MCWIHVCFLFHVPFFPFQQQRKRSIYNQSAARSGGNVVYESEWKREDLNVNYKNLKKTQKKNNPIMNGISRTHENEEEKKHTMS